MPLKRESARPEARSVDPPSPSRPFPSPHLVLGGAKSGKSEYAERLVMSLPPPYLYIATAEVLDEEMKHRVHRHRMRRGEEWDTVETPVELAQQLTRLQGQQRPVLVDCLTLWLSNLLFKEASLSASVEELCRIVHVVDYPLVFVSNEVGGGIVPENALARRFRDEAGRANQQVASACRGVTYVIAGLPLPLKGARAEPLIE